MDALKRETVPCCLSVEELEKAEPEMVRFCQKKFPEEFSTLQNGKNVKGHSLWRLTIP